MSQVESRRNIRVLFVDDDPGFRKVMATEISRMGFDVDPAADVPAARVAIEEKDYDVALLDLRMPKIGGEKFLPELKTKAPWCEVIVLTAHADVDAAVDCMKKGAYDFLTKPCPLDQIEILIEKAAEKRSLATRCDSLERPAHRGGALGESPAFRRIHSMLDQIAPSDEPVLILGESGVGKELLAEEIVRRSGRADRPFITVNCSAFTESLLESEMFGHEKGAFTGADSRRIGVFQLAGGGTILLDEIGDMPTAMQAKLLRVLQSGEVRPVGGQHAFHVNVRVISATNQDLARMIETGHFRTDLFYRLNTFMLTLPPLRERQEDIPTLAEHFLARAGERLGRKLELTPKTLQKLMAYPWPGNIRELENVVKRAAILATGDRISPDLLPENVRMPQTETLGGLEITRLSSEELEKLHLIRMLEACEGNKRETARRLGVSNKTLYNKLHAYGIDLDVSGGVREAG